MHRNAILFWVVIGLLLSASLFYGVNASKQRRRIHHSGGVLVSGDIVRLHRIIDGDTIMVAKEGDAPATVRILGIKALESKVAKDPASLFGRASILELERRMAGRPVRVMLNSTPKDSRGRFLATLYVNDKDMGLELIREGLALVYSVYPFPAMSIYLHEQELARAGKKGLWADPEVKRRAIALIEEWQGQSQ
jgi:endonuclease YncB( thermonuclease family)